MYNFSLTMHLVTRIYWAHGYDNPSARNRARKYWTYFTDAWTIYWMHGWQSLRIIRTHALHGANSWSAEKKLARSCDLNTRPLLSTSLNPFYNCFIYLFQIFIQDCLFSQRLVFHRALCHKIQSESNKVHTYNKI